ncbi:MAG: hypothetical protein JWN32_3463 [Solirubrobacterales bacterium]|nr:hypothetical protein [Solirubrobacterales bacterium]
MPVRRLIPLALCLALAAPAPAVAATRVASARVTAGPVLAGKRVYWAEGGGRTALTVRVARPGRQPEVVWTRPRPLAGRQQFVVRIAHSGTKVEVLWRELDTGTACRPATLTRDLALAGRRSVSVTEEDGCAPVTQRFRVLLHAAGSTRTVSLATGAAPVANLTAAGEFVAWQQQGARGAGDPITVYDVANGRVAYTVRDPALTIGHDQLALRRDGRLGAALFDPSASTVGPRYDLSWYDDAHPRGVPLLGLFASGGPIAFAGDRIAFERPLGGGVTELTLTNLAGTTRNVATFHAGRSQLVGFDYDGARVVWAQRKPGGAAQILTR